jgi:hypothetical protein
MGLFAQNPRPRKDVRATTHPHRAGRRRRASLIIEVLEARVALATTTAVTASTLNPDANAQVTLTATVAQTTTGTPAPTGNVEFLDNGTPLGTGTLANGQATLTVSNLAVGKNSVTAQYLGDTNNPASASGVITLSVGTSNEQFINAVYEQDLGRAVESQGLAYWDQKFAAGWSRTEVVAAIVRSQESRTDAIQADFNAYLGRDGTASEVSNGVALALSSGRGLKAVILSSPQFLKTETDGTLSGYLSALSSAVIGTPFSSQVRTYLTNEIANGTPLIQVAEQVLLSQPAKDAVVQAAFQSTLGRAPTSSELTADTGNPGQGIDLAQLKIDLLASDEFFTNATNASAAATTTSLTSSANPATAGQSVTFTATVAPVTHGGLTPTGNVIFLAGSSVLGSATLTDGVATLATAALPVGTTPVTAQYDGDVNFGGSTSSSLSQTVGSSASSSTAVAASASSTVFGQSVTITANVSGQGQTGTPTGTVEFFSGSTLLGTETLNSAGAAAFTTTALPVGGDAITAQYQGDANFSASTSAQSIVTVSQATTTATVSASSSSAVFGQSVTLTANVAPVSPGAGTPSGTVQFFNGTTSLGTATLNSNGTASLSTTALPLGADAISAQYEGDTNFVANTSPSSTVTVTQASSNASLSASPNPAVIGQSVTLSATIAAVSPGSGTPTGTVQFLNGATVLGTASLNASGVAVFNTSALPAGADSLTAVYEGDTNFSTSTSTATVEHVTGTSASTTSVATSPASPVFGQSVTLTATVAAGSGASGTPTGSVEFFNGSTSLGTGTLDSTGVATLMTTSLPTGTLSITATYQGDATFAQSTSSAQSVTVAQASSNTTLSASPNPSTSGESVTLTATVTAVTPGGGTPSGTVEFLNGAVALGTASLDANGVATLAVTSLPVGTDSLTASYFGDSNFKTSVSTAVSQVVNS